MSKVETQKEGHLNKTVKRFSAVFIVNFKHISYLVLVPILFT